MLNDLSLVGSRLPTNAEFLRKGEVRRIGYEMEDADGIALIVTPRARQCAATGRQARRWRVRSVFRGLHSAACTRLSSDAVLDGRDL